MTEPNGPSWCPTNMFSSTLFASSLIYSFSDSFCLKQDSWYILKQQQQKQSSWSSDICRSSQPTYVWIVLSHSALQLQFTTFSVSSQSQNCCLDSSGHTWVTTYSFSLAWRNAIFLPTHPYRRKQTTIFPAHLSQFFAALSWFFHCIKEKALVLTFKVLTMPNLSYFVDTKEFYSWIWSAFFAKCFWALSHLGTIPGRCSPNVLPVIL